MTRRYLPLLAWLAFAGLPSPTLAQPVGAEFRVNTHTTDRQNAAAVASDASGNFVVVWESYGQDGSRTGIFGQRYESDGSSLGGEFQVNTYTTDDQWYPSVASDAVGNFVVVWKSGGLYSHDVFGQRYDSGGDPLGGEFKMNREIVYGYRAGGPSVASDARGNFVVVWASHYTYGQRYDALGNPQGEIFEIFPDCCGHYNIDPSVASDASGKFVVAWTDYRPGSYGGGESDKYQVYVQRYDNNGEPLGGKISVDPDADILGGPSVASDATGNFVVVWNDGFLGLRGDRYDSDGNQLGGTFVIDADTIYGGDGSVAYDATGTFVVVWQSQDDFFSSQDVLGQRYDSAGNRLGEEFQVNTYTTYNQAGPSVASDASGNFLVAWSGTGQGDDLGVFGQRFSAGCEASVQVEGDVHTPGSTLSVQVHIAHRRPKTVTVPWEMTLLDPSGQVVLKHETAMHTFEPGDVVDRNVEFRLPNDLASGTYTLELAIRRMAGTKGATTTLQVIRSSASMRGEP